MPNWGQLFAQGRCKAVGIPWSEEEANAVYHLHIPAQFVRRGALTQEAFQAMKEADAAHLKGEGELPLAAMTHTELLRKAGELVEVTSAATDADLINVITASKPVEKKSVAKKTKK